MRPVLNRWLLIVAPVLAFTVGCAHTGPDPFIYGADELGGERAKPPECFSAPLAGCVGDPTQREPVERLASPWNEGFEPDLAHRICRGDAQARRRWLEGARHLAEDDPREGVYLEFLDRCSTPGFCAWAIKTAGSELEPLPARRLLFESARRWCGDTLEPDKLDHVGSTLGRSPADEPPWVTSSQQIRCAEVSRHEDPWQDIAGLHAAGCLDLGEWIDRHRDAVDATAAALERCVKGSEIRYQEANCLRELAGLDRERAVALVRSDDRRGWGISSTITRYARILLRFPETGQLEAELTRLGLLPSGSSPPAVSGQAPVLPEEVLEQRGRLANFSPGCAARYCEHAPLMYQLIDLASPVLDNVVLEERWPALETIGLGSGPRQVSTSIGGIPVTLRVAEHEDGGFDRDEYDRLRTVIENAQERPHVLTAYSKGRAYRLHIRHLGEWYDLETLLAGLNTILADRGNDLRYVTLDPHCVPCAKVVAGPGNGLVEAAFAGLIEVADPFKELWTQRGFEPPQALR
ncbi:MAG: hypothetical protein ACC742_08260 [Thermoanaerobaculales bacterium]